MDTKDIVSQLRDLIDTSGIIFGPNVTILFNRIIEKLERGKAFEDMWGELYDWYGDKSCTDYDWAVCSVMEGLEEKHFPKNEVIK